jgi:Protein of unknown function
MTEEDAKEIQKCALEACGALNRMEAIVSKLSKEDRLSFATHFGEAYEALDFGILRKVYDCFPDLRIGHEEPPKVSSFLRWDDVSLPTGVSEADLDAAIFSVLKSNWQKTATVISKAQKWCDSHGTPLDLEILGARIQALAEERQIESQGNVSKWRQSEVRLKQS